MIKSWGLETSNRYAVAGGLRQLHNAIWRPLERRSLIWSDPAEARRYAGLRQRLRMLVDGTSDVDRSPTAARALRVSALLLPAAGFWLLLAAVFGLRFRPRGLWAPILLAAASVLAFAATAVAFPPHPDYALPYVPAFALLGIGAIAGSRRRSSG